MNISFVIPVLNGEKYIRQCIESILSESQAADDITVVDNGSTDGTVNIIKSYANVRLLVCPELTVSALRNRGAAESDNPLLAFIDSDCILTKGWRQQVVNVLADESIHSAGSLVDVPDDACWIEKAWFSQKPDRKKFADYINTGNLVVKRKVFNEIKGFDESLISDEDCDFGERLNKAGYRMLEDPAIRVIHLDNPTSLKAFYLREAWHATSVLTLNSSEIFNRPTIMTIIFGLTILISLGCVATSVLIDVNLLWVTLSVLLVPLVTALYRVYQFKKYRYIAELTLLWGIFYLVRLNNMVRHLFSRKAVNA